MVSVEMRGISKSYALVQALSGVDFTLEKGVIHALLGENGAGKTTLMKILYGMEKPDSGTIAINGKPVEMHDSLDAIREKIGMVHQHFMLIPIMTVAENIVVNEEPRKGVWLDAKKAVAEVEELSKSCGFSVDPMAKVGNLSVGQCQRVEILKVLYRGADILIFDEPTAVLTPLEVDEFFETLRQLREMGKSIVIITHKLHEVMDIADKVTVLRDGHLIGNVDKKDTSREDLASMMVGRQVALGTQNRSANIGPVVCSIENLTYTRNGRRVLNNINLQIRGGEILGIAGIEGNGQVELLEAITGLLKPDSLTMRVNGREITGDAKRFLLQGVGHVPEDRGRRGLAADLSLAENVILGYEETPAFSRHGLMRWGEVNSYGRRLMAEYGIKSYSERTKISTLSGGNQQKAMVARAFSQNPDFVVCAQPTRGVDIAAAEIIHQVMYDYRDQGKAVLMISADLDEVKNTSDTIAVMYKGEIRALDKADAFDDKRLGLLMTGVSEEGIQ